MNRKTKSENPMDILKKRSRKGVATKIADVEDVSPAEVDEINEIPFKKERKPRAKKLPGKKKADKGDGLREITNRADAILKAVFSKHNTDRIHDGFSVDCNCGMPADLPGALIITANLRIGKHRVYGIESYVFNFPGDIKCIAMDLYYQVVERGMILKERIGV